MKPPNVISIQHVACEGPGLIVTVFKERGISLETIDIFENQPVPDDPRDGLVVLGGPMGAYDSQDLFPTVQDEVRLIQKAMELDKPVIGICLGSQLLAKACGADVFKGKNGPEIGWFPIRLGKDAQKDPIFSGLPPELTVFHWHGDTFNLPQGASLLAGSGLYEHQIFRVGNNLFGFQCHLEVTETMVREWLEVYRKELTTHGGKVLPGPIEKDLEKHVRDLEPHARLVFFRLAELFIPK